MGVNWADGESVHEYLCQFQDEFKKLVRKFMPVYPATPSVAAALRELKPDVPIEISAEKSRFLARMQDSLSVYSPYIWSDE